MGFADTLKSVHRALVAQDVAFYKSMGFSLGGDMPSPLGLSSNPWPTLLPSTRVDYRVEAGDSTQSALVMSTVNWICRTFPEAPLRVVKEAEGSPRPEPVIPHPLVSLWRQPNPYYNGLLMMQALLVSWNLDGNAYLIKARNGYQQTGELWYEPHYSIRPVWPDDGSVFILGYQVKRKGRWLEQIIPREDVIHLRNGLDPYNPRVGLSPLASAFREIFTDNEAANFSASLLRNLGIPGVLVSPATPDQVIENGDEMKDALMSRFSGDRRGEPAILSSPMKVDVLSFSPEQMNLETLRNIPEERITALLGVPAIVVGLGAGLDKATFANYETALFAAYHGNILPTQRLWAAQLETDLLPEFSKDATERAEFDTSNVHALAEDKNDLYKRISDGYRFGWLKRSDARLLSGEALDIDDTADDLYFTDIPKFTDFIQQSDEPGAIGPDGAPVNSGTPAGDDTTPPNPKPKPKKPKAA